MFSKLKNNRVQDLATIIELQQAVVISNTNLENLMELICQKTQPICEADGAVVEILSGDEMVYQAGSGTLEFTKGLRLKAATSLSGLCVRQAEVLYCEDSEIDSRVDREACRRVGARSMICVPLMNSGHAIGVLKVISNQPKKFIEKDISLLRLIAGLLSSKLDQAREKEEKEQIAEALRESEHKAREANRMKSEFLANMSHEIRTPLNGVMGVADLLLTTELTDHQKQYADVIKSSAHILLTIVNDILDFSKIEANKLTIENIEFSLVEILENLKRVFTLPIEKKGLAFNFRVPQGLPTLVKGDPTRLQQILTNLISNAVKFTNKGSIEFSVEILKYQGAKINLKFSVQDTGIGIPEVFAKDMFKPFSQVDASTTRKYGGTGLGLSICHRLSELMSGQVGVESQEGIGSNFWLVLPLEVITKSHEQVRSDVLKLEKTSKLNILVAEDNKTNQMVIVAMLTQLGHRSVIAENGQQVLEKLKTENFDLILMDCQMPVMDGYEASRLIRGAKDQPWSQIEIAAMTASALAGDRQKCLESGMTDYVTKPMSLSELENLLARMQARSRVGVEV